MAHREGVPRTRPGNRDFLCFCVFADRPDSLPPHAPSSAVGWPNMARRDGVPESLAEAARRRVLHFVRAAPRVEGAGVMPDGRRQGSKVYCLSLRPRERALCRGGPHRPRREHRAAALCRRVLHLFRAAPRAEGTLSAPASPQRRGVLQLACTAPRVEGTG